MQGLALRSVLQPIIDAETGTVIAHEALLRGPAGTPWESPAALFAEAARRGESDRLEMDARRLAIARLADLPTGQSLFINVDPILAHSVPPIIAPMDRVVLEVTELRSILDNASLMDHITAWRDYGYRIAVDDYGVGYMGLGAALTVRPDIVKIDRSITAGILQDPTRRAAVTAILYVCSVAGVVVIAEGVETAEDYWVLRRLGIRYMQGFLFARPRWEPYHGPLALPPRPADEPDLAPALLDPSTVHVWR